MNVTEEASGVKTADANFQTAFDLQEQIRRRAYELYEQRGRQDGHEREDWLRAEAEILQTITEPIPNKTVKTNRSRSPRTRNKKAKPS